MTVGLDGRASVAAAPLGWYRSLLSRLGAAPLIALLGLVAAAEVVHGFRVLGTPWIGGDLLYHEALAHAVLRGEVPPGGPYAGLPTYYPPGFHLLLAGAMAVTGFDAVHAEQLLTLLWLPVLPVATYLLARRITGRAWIAVLAVALTLFAGGYDLRAGRLWVNSLFLGGQEAYPLYPRDLVFGLLPLAVLAVLRALDSAALIRCAAWAAGAGVLFGLAGLAQIQLLLPLPAAVAVGAAVTAVRVPSRRATALVTVAVSAVVAALLVAPWLVSQLDLVARNGGVALDSSDALEPARFGFWSYPRQFGLLLPLGIVGAGTALAWLRGTPPDAISPALASWRPRPVEAGVLLVTWWVLPFALGILYRPDWPLEDALRPQRLWLLAGQPLAILAAIGLALVADVAVRRLRKPQWAVPAVVAVVLVASLPATAVTTRVLASTWTRPAYAHLDLGTDRVPDFASLLGDRGAPRSTVLTYEDWSSLVWYVTGQQVVAIVPAGFAKLAYDPAVFTGRSQAVRRDDVRRAFSGSLDELVGVADAYRADRIVVARRDDRWGLTDVSAAVGERRGSARLVVGNGWDGVELASGSAIGVGTAATGPARVEIRLVGTPQTPSGVTRQLAIIVGTGEIARLAVPATNNTYVVADAEVDLPSGMPLEIVARTPVTIQSIRVFSAPPPLPVGWRVSDETPDAIVLGRT